jgi:hypothetical protein
MTYEVCPHDQSGSGAKAVQHKVDCVCVAARGTLDFRGRSESIVDSTAKLLGGAHRETNQCEGLAGRGQQQAADKQMVRAV